MNEVKEVLRKISDLLENIGEIYWNNKIRSFVDAKDDPNITELKSLFGRMGSLNDIYICSENGHKISEKEEVIYNKKLVELIE